MIRKQLIERESLDGDRRTVLIKLSSKGKRLVDQFRKRRSDIFNNALARLGDDEQSEVIEAFEKVIKCLESYEGQINCAERGSSSVRETSGKRSKSSKGKRKMKTIKSKIVALVAMLVLATSAAVAAPSVSNETDASSQQQISKQVRHELVTLPYYGVFDNLAYKIDGGTVTLFGQVVRPSTSDDAEKRVGKIAGVSQVVNNIEVLPPSPSDDNLRIQAYRAIFRSAGLYR